MTDRFRSRADHLVPADIARYETSLVKVNNLMGYRLFRNPDGSAVKNEGVFVRLGSVPLMLGVLFAGLWAWMAWKLYRYDPQPQDVEAGNRWDPIRGIGGWLILVALIVLFTPVRLLVMMSKVLPSYAGDVWGALTNTGSASFHPLWAPLLTFELAANLALLVFSLLLLVLFFQKRSSFPKLFVSYLVAAFACQLVDLLMGMALPASAQAQPAEWGELARAAIGMLIWGAYFNRSRRVAATFVNRRTRPTDPIGAGNVHHGVTPI